LAVKKNWFGIFCRDVRTVCCLSVSSSTLWGEFSVLVAWQPNSSRWIPAAR